MLQILESLTGDLPIVVGAFGVVLLLMVSIGTWAGYLIYVIIREKLKVNLILMLCSLFIV